MRFFAQLRQRRSDQRKLLFVYGEACSQCLKDGNIPAPVLLPQFRCRVCGTLDTRPGLTLEQRRRAGTAFR